MFGLKTIFWVTAILGASLYAIHTWLLEAWRVPSDDPALAASVEPTLSAGDLVLVWRGTSFNRGNLLRCPDPQAPGRFVVARAMGGPGERVEIRDERVLIDGKREPSPRVCDQSTYTLFDPGRNSEVELLCTVEEYGALDFSALRLGDHPETPTHAVVAPDKWYLVSDNRHIHVDSRDYGELDPASCHLVVFRLWSAQGIGDVHSRFRVIW